MSVEFLNILKKETKTSDVSSGEAHWAKRKAVLREKRGSVLQHHGHHKARRRRQISQESTPAHTDTSNLSETTGKPPPSSPSRVSAGEDEWIGVTGGPRAEVVLRLHPAPSDSPRTNMSSLGTDVGGSGVVVRAEEALIVAFVLLLWIAAIALFFNRWGKIRMLEPYQPKFQQQHRQSSCLADSSVALAPHNSVFVGSMGGMALIPESPPRRSRSAADLPALVPPSEHSAQATPRASRAASLHSAVDLRVCVPSPRTSRAASLHSAVDMPQGSVQVHVRGSGSNLNRPRSPRRLTITNV